jgi:hypothetical protein
LARSGRWCRRLGPQSADDRSQRGAELRIGFRPEFSGELSFLIGRNERAESLDTPCELGGTRTAVFSGPRRVEHDIGKALLSVWIGDLSESR